MKKVVGVILMIIAFISIIMLFTGMESNAIIGALMVAIPSFFIGVKLLTPEKQIKNKKDIFSTGD